MISAVIWNLPVGSHDSVTWKRSTDVLTGCHGNIIQRNGGYLPPRHYSIFHLRFAWDVLETTNGTSWLGSFETSLQRSCATSGRRTTETPWHCTTETLLDVSFETSLRCRGDVPMVLHCFVILRHCPDVPSWRRGGVPMGVLAELPWDVVGCFIWEVPAMSLGRTELRRYYVLTTSSCQVENRNQENTMYHCAKIHKIWRILNVLAKFAQTIR